VCTLVKVLEIISLAFVSSQDVLICCYCCCKC